MLKDNYNTMLYNVMGTLTGRGDMCWKYKEETIDGSGKCEGVCVGACDMQAFR